MHCMLAWGREPGKTPLTDEEHETLEQALHGHSWTRPATGIYVIGLSYGPSERNDILSDLKGAAKENGLRSVVMLMSPTMKEDSGLYIGVVEKSQWDEINKRSGHREYIEKLNAETNDEDDTAET